MTSPPNFMSFAALNNSSRLNSPIQSPFLSPFPSSPSSPGIEPRRTKSRHMDTFSFFDAKPQSPGPFRESSSSTTQGSFLHDHSAHHHQQVQQHLQQQQYSQPPQPQLVRWDSFQSNPSSPFPTSRAMTPGGSRPPMPRQWTAQTDPFSNDTTPLASPSLASMTAGLGTAVGEDGDEVISTAVVVKNIPFSLKKEALLELFDQMTLPKPYAFNYHFDNGTFRGLAFANFHSPEETQHVIRALNGYELIGRKLRVEYKKVLPADQRERIELQKRHKVSQEDPMLAAGQRGKIEKKLEIDLNDAATLQIYSSLLLFRDDNSPTARTQMAFPPEFSTHQRRVVHLISQKLGLDHSSRGEGEGRYIVISKIENDSESSGGSQLGSTSGTFASHGFLQQVQSQHSHQYAPQQQQQQQAQLGQNRAGSPGPLRIDTKSDVTQRKAFGNVHAPHLQPPGLNKMRSYDNLRAPSPLRTSAGASGSDYFNQGSSQGSSSPYVSPVPSYPNPLASPGVGIVMAGLAEVSLGNTVPTRQPKGPDVKNAFVSRTENKKEREAYE